MEFIFGFWELNRGKILCWIDRLILTGFCVLIFFLPIAHTEAVRAFSFGIPLGLWILKMALQRRWLVRRTPLDLPILLFTGAAALSLVTAVDFRYSLEEFTGEWLTGVILFYLLANNFREEWLKPILGALILANLLIVVYGWYDFFRQGGTLFDYQVRAGSLHYIAGALATYLATVLPLFWVGLFACPGAAGRAVAALLLLANLFTLYLTHVRGAWVAALAVGLLVCVKFRSQKTALVLIGIAAAIVLLIAPQGTLIHHAPLENADSQEARIDTARARWEVWKFSWERLRESPLQMLGFGRRSFVKRYPEFYEKYKGALLWHAHNTFLNVGLQTGVQGLVLFLFLVFKLLKFTYRRAELEGEPLKKVFLFAVFFMVISFFGRNLWDDFFVDDSALLFWLLSGAAVALEKG
jgi:O-antigen ligase